MVSPLASTEALDFASMDSRRYGRIEERTLFCEWPCCILHLTHQHAGAA